MSYSKKAVTKVMDEYRVKPIAARKAATERRAETESKFPDIKEIDVMLAEFGFRIYEVISSGLTQSEKEKKLDELREENEKLQKKKSALLVSHGYPADYTQIHYECEECLDTGYAGIEMCSCMKSALNRESFTESGLGVLAEHQTFSGFDLSVYSNRSSAQYSPEIFEVMKKNFDICVDYAESFTPASPSLLFIGGVGLGKTHLSSAIGRRIIERGYYVIYESAPNILLAFEKERFAKADEETETSKYYDCDLLIIDDLGTEFANRISLSNVYNIINTRLIQSKPTLINTNLSYKQLEKQYESRIISRLFGEFRVLLFEGTDYRRIKKNV